MTQQHTPGPWHTCPTRDAVHAKHNGYDIIVAIVSHNMDPLTDCQCETNARLIAAAPDMLEALLAARRALSLCWAHGTTVETIGKNPDVIAIDAAIAKARGE